MKETKMLSAIMKRYESLTGMSEALREDEDTVLLNLIEDMEDEVSEENLMDYITLTVGYQF